MTEKKNKSKIVDKKHFNYKESLKMKVFPIFRKSLIGFILASLVNFCFSYFVHTPKVYSLAKENSELILKFKALQQQIEEQELAVSTIADRNREVYSEILGVENLLKDSISVWDSNHDQYRTHRYATMIDDTWSKLNNVASSLYNESVNLDTMQYLGADREKMMSSLPSIWPIDKHRLRNSIGAFGRRFHPVHHTYKFHSGADFAMDKGSPVYSTADGVVEEAAYRRGYGYSILINHGYGYKTRYAHLQKYLVEKGDKVVRGEHIAESGNSGVSSGPHLHYEVIHRGTPVNPLNYFSQEMKDEDFFKIINAAKETTYE